MPVELAPPDLVAVVLGTKLDTATEGSVALPYALQVAFGAKGQVESIQMACS